MLQFSTRPPGRKERFAMELADCAIAAEALARRMQANEELRPRVRQHAEQVALAARTLCLAAVAVHGRSTPDLRLAFGRYLGAAALNRESLLGEVDDEGGLD